MRTWSKSFQGAWQLYGHSHGHLPDDPELLAIDVGVDCFDFTPVNFDKVSIIMHKTKSHININTKRLCKQCNHNCATFRNNRTGSIICGICRFN
jgi:hypothetical protein